MTNAFPADWSRPTAVELRGSNVVLRRLDADADVQELYDVSHGSEAATRLWTYMPYGPFPNRDAMREWMRPLAMGDDPRFYSVYSNNAQAKVGMISILNIVPEMGRAELGHIWYGPAAQKTLVNTETIYLLLKHLFDDLGYRRAEWKCDDANAESKRAALRLGFQYEGLFRQHMVIKGKNRDTAWFSIIDREWSTVRSNFEAFLAASDLSLTELNRNRAVNI